ncbi:MULTISPECIES: hypothetical protein [unclassified Streptomyces]|uniref:hypothetical protein n=1 Tax=unclassified Streptomyces TaxID=2593676 RepID=UPI0033C2B05F
MSDNPSVPGPRRDMAMHNGWWASGWDHVPVPGQDAHRYGILQPRTSPRGHQLLDELLEKPTEYRQTTAYINISRTLLPGDAITYFEKLIPAANGEYQATDAILAFARDHDLLIHPVTGRYFDCGNPAGWLAANNVAAHAQGLTTQSLNP